MALSTQNFWDSYYANLHHVEGMEWYVDDVIIFEELKKHLALHNSSSFPFPRILHVGCGVGSLAGFLETLNDPCDVIHIDIVPEALSMLQKTDFQQSFPPLSALLACSVTSMPLREGSVDLMVGKGTFDSVSMGSEGREERVFSFLSEAARVLREGGLYFLFSLFEPCGEEKDMMGLLCHPSFSVMSYSLPYAPYELPHQPFIFLYVLTKNQTEP